VARFLTYDVRLNHECTAYCRAIMEWPAMAEWVRDAKAEPVEMDELDMEFCSRRGRNDLVGKGTAQRSARRSRGSRDHRADAGALSCSRSTPSKAKRAPTGNSSAARKQKASP
jgi:hypothetical protein